MRKLTVKEFFESKEKLCVRVTKEEYDTYAKALDEAGYTWCGGCKYVEYNPFEKSLKYLNSEFLYISNDCTRYERILYGQEEVLLELEQPEVLLDLEQPEVQTGLEPLKTVAEYIDSLNNEIEPLCKICYKLKNNDDCTGNLCIKCDLNREKTSNLIAIAKFLNEPVTNYIKQQPFEKGTIIEVSDDGKYWFLAYFIEFKNGNYHAKSTYQTDDIREWNFAHLPKGVE